MEFNDAIVFLKKELKLKYRQYKPLEIQRNELEIKRLAHIKNIENIAWKILKSIKAGEFPVLEIRTHVDQNGCVDNDSLQIEGIQKRRKLIDFKRISRRLNFTSIIFLLSKIHKLLLTKQTCTRRSLYYNNLEIFQSQKYVDINMKDVSSFLNAPPWELGVLATSKGVVFGPLILKLSNGEVIDCSRKGGACIPTNVTEIEKISSSASWVLIVEKDSCFQHLISKYSFKVDNYIAITGKGYPDASTRMLVCKFWEQLQIPLLALVDADPHGFEIMCIYRFGSMSMSSYSNELACPAVRWLGVHPNDIQPLLLNFKTLSFRDIHKIHHLFQRQYVKDNEGLKTQLKFLLEKNIKAEIEGVSSISTNYLSQVYLKNKIRYKDYF